MSGPGNIKHIIENGVKQPIKYAPRLDASERPRFNYHHCAADHCDGYFATLRGLKEHFEFVHRIPEKASNSNNLALQTS